VVYRMCTSRAERAVIAERVVNVTCYGVKVGAGGHEGQHLQQVLPGDRPALGAS
jgi:hypothetical protein